MKALAFAVVAVFTVASPAPALEVVKFDEMSIGDQPAIWSCFLVAQREC